MFDIRMNMPVVRMGVDEGGPERQLRVVRGPSVHAGRAAQRHRQ